MTSGEGVLCYVFAACCLLPVLKYIYRSVNEPLNKYAYYET